MSYSVFCSACCRGMGPDGRPLDWGRSGTILILEFSDAESARENMRQCGWLTVGKFDFCPSCVLHRQVIKEMGVEFDDALGAELREPMYAAKEGRKGEVV